MAGKARRRNNQRWTQMYTDEKPERASVPYLCPSVFICGFKFIPVLLTLHNDAMAGDSFKEFAAR
jgi:hypothetical protein